MAKPAREGHSLPSPTNPVWWRSMHAISSYRGNRPTNPQTHKQTQPQTQRQDSLQYTTPLSLARSVTIADVKSLDFTSICFLMKLFKSSNMYIINVCLLHFKFSLPIVSWFKKERRNFLANLFIVTISFGNSELTLLRLFFFCVFFVYTVLPLILFGE